MRETRHTYQVSLSLLIYLKNFKNRLGSKLSFSTCDKTDYYNIHTFGQILKLG